ncbi:set domain [Chlorella sorokiniana]|uniref:Set domain n=1 Tax=Chlorella sorokiniana TaxID=3076 RepID=A0A2P6TPH9_CHLSO|nr:set domain [Chlorella sorokiniana]|eukprot:PRW55940.1 set domain [Chlorella sorokiniana]
MSATEPSAAAAAAAPPAATAASAAFHELAAAALDTCAVQLQPCAVGHGLYLTAPAAAGDVVLSVPVDRCLVVDYSGAGLRLPQGQWPRLLKAVQKDDSLPWDILQALALLDALAGGADPFWERYAAEVLPAPLALTLPLCFPAELLPELQHGAIIAAAQAQQQRLAALFPGLSGAMCEGGPSWLQWSFACVRSRAFELRKDCFGFVPFLDGANHAPDPSCDFRLSADGHAVELVALHPLQAGDEATISYTGPAGMTNQRLMAQYGFVFTGGNPADRLQFAALAGPGSGVAGGSISGSESDEFRLSGGSSQSSLSSLSSSSSPSSGLLLSLDRMQAALGDGERMAAALSGKDPYSYAALKSLPFAAEEGAAAEVGQQVALAEHLAAELAAEAASWPTSMEQDSDLVAQQRAAAAAAAAASSSSGGSGGSAAPDARLAAALAYRLQRKALVTAGQLLLRSFVAGGPQA